MHFLFTGIAFIVLGLAKSYPSLDDKDLDDERIVGGYLIHIEHAPYQVSWQNNFKGKFSHYCGGSLISEKFVLSAAHCFLEFFESKLCIGSSKSVCENDLVNVKKTILHSGWNNETNENDIAILELEEAVQFSEKIQPIKLVDDKEIIKAGENVKVSGWGRLREGSVNASSELMAVELPIVDHDECHLQLGNEILTEGMICAGFFEGGKDACQGDSGGPLKRESDGALVGIVSWGPGCARPGMPGVYTNVAYYRDWIREMSGV